MAKKKKSVKISRPNNRRKNKKKKELMKSIPANNKIDFSPDYFDTAIAQGIDKIREEVVSTALPHKVHIKEFGKYYDYSKVVFERVSSDTRVKTGWINSNQFHKSILYSLSKTIASLCLVSHAGLMNASCALLYRKAYECSVIIELDILGLIPDENKELYINRYLKENYDVTKNFNNKLLGEEIESITIEGNDTFNEKLKIFCNEHELKSIKKGRNNWTIGIKGKKPLGFKQLLELSKSEDKDKILGDWHKLSALGHNSEICNWKEFKRNEYMEWPFSCLEKYYNTQELNYDFNKKTIPKNTPIVKEQMYRYSFNKTKSTAVAELFAFADSAYLIWFILDLIWEACDGIIEDKYMDPWIRMMKTNALTYEMGYRNSSVVFFRNIVHFMFSKIIGCKKLEGESDTSYFKRVSDENIKMEWKIDSHKVKFSDHLSVLIDESNSYVHPASYEVYSIYSNQDQVMDGFLFFPMYILAEIIKDTSEEKYRFILMLVNKMKILRMNKSNSKITF